MPIVIDAHLHCENGQPHAEDPVGQLYPRAGATAAAAASSDLRLEKEGIIRQKFTLLSV